MSNSWLDARLRQIKVLPTIALDRAEDAVPLAETLAAAGLGGLEITLRTAAALPALRLLSARGDLPLLLAAGTLRNPDDMRAAFDAGAQLLVSPGHTASLLALADRLQLPWLPGCATASDVMVLAEHGYRVQKLFPATLGLLDALAGPFPDIAFVPSSGVDATTAADWLGKPNVAAIAGSWIAPRAAIAAEDWAGIAERAQAIATLLPGRPA